jgi:hypothetical protein
LLKISTLNKQKSYEKNLNNKKSICKGSGNFILFLRIEISTCKIIYIGFFFIKVLINGDELLILNAHVLNHLIFMIKKNIPFINTIIKKNQLVQNKIT